MKASNRAVLRFDDRWFRLLGIPFAGAIINFLIMPEMEGTTPANYLKYLFSSIFYTFIYWEFNRVVLIRLRQRYPEVKDTVKRLAITGIIIGGGVLFITFIVGLGVNLAMNALLADHMGPPPFARILIVTILFNVLFTGIYEAIYSVIGWSDSQLQTEKLKRESLQSQLDNLKSRVNPHFLFNSLNTLSALIPERPDDAVKAVEQLARTYRYLLAASEKEVVQVREELENVQAYLFLLQTRFGSALRVDIAVPEALQDRFVVPLAVQMLVENCIKHNVVRQKEPLRIRIGTEGEDWLVVENAVRPRPRAAEGTGTGLRNIRRRYELVAQSAIEVHADSERFRVKLPLLNIQPYAHSDH
ncbi:MAG: histidine kinase [Bacteroidota bacterium]